MRKLSGGGDIYYKYIHIATADCPSETGGRGAKRRRGWIRKLAAHYYLDYLSTPSPLRGTHPCLRGRKWMLGHCKNNVITFSPRQQTVPLRQGANEVFREMTKCHFVPHEGSTTQCDAGPARERSDGGGGQNHSLLPITFPPPPHCVVLAPVPGGESGCSDIAGTLWLQFHRDSRLSP